MITQSGSEIISLLILSLNEQSWSIIKVSSPSIALNMAPTTVNGPVQQIIHLENPEGILPDLLPSSFRLSQTNFGHPTVSKSFKALFKHLDHYSISVTRRSTSCLKT
ncbi:uncharacterized protein VTP21DRAFT_5378 [Calcarisporiella thermophila]|uniref:uncharacterized protein n=1 Tax=Calcarisporiella thermophila TaxID=911321 RepID=UPI003743B8F6